ncbi:MAG: hypothetical protein HC929_18970 [Leptolyngbyaceae cyanobacterium SM2_5_2]|nr:hypothetical protein [Leptolyngbyaceae cyanobacterium SM2_5_2]
MGENFDPELDLRCKYVGRTSSPESTTTASTKTIRGRGIFCQQFQNILGADITFPAVGEYRVVLMGRPRAEARFVPFELSYTLWSPQAVPLPAKLRVPPPPPPRAMH